MSKKEGPKEPSEGRHAIEMILPSSGFKTGQGKLMVGQRKNSSSSQNRPDVIVESTNLNISKKSSLNLSPININNVDSNSEDPSKNKKLKNLSLLAVDSVSGRKVDKSVLRTYKDIIKRQASLFGILNSNSDLRKSSFGQCDEKTVDRRSQQNISATKRYKFSLTTKRLNPKFTSSSTKLEPFDSVRPKNYYYLGANRYRSFSCDNNVDTLKEGFHESSRYYSESDRQEDSLSEEESHHNDNDSSYSANIIQRFSEDYNSEKSSKEESCDNFLNDSELDKSLISESGIMWPKDTNMSDDRDNLNDQVKKTEILAVTGNTPFIESGEGYCVSRIRSISVSDPSDLDWPELEEEEEEEKSEISKNTISLQFFGLEACHGEEKETVKPLIYYSENNINYINLSMSSNFNSTLLDTKLFRQSIF